MYFKEQRFEKTKASTLASTHKVELPDSGLLDSILMYLRAVNDTDVYQDKPSHIPPHITKVEVIGDTDKILFSMTGECAIAKAFRKMRSMPAMKQNGYGNKTQDQMIPIFFGKHYKDGQYLLDLSKWDKVELQVTNDFSSSYFTSLTMETRLVTLEDSIEAHPKFLKQWEYDASTPDADADYVRPKLPTTGLLRALMIQLQPTLTASTGAVAEDPAGDSYNWKLWFRDRALTIYDHRPRDLMRDEHMRLGVGHSCLKPYPSATQYTDRHWAEVLAVAMAHTENAADVTVLSEKDSRDRIATANFAGTTTFYQLLVQGVGLFHTFEIPFFLQDLETEYLNLANYKPVEIEWYAHKEDNTHRTILEKPIGQGPAEFA